MRKFKGLGLIAACLFNIIIINRTQTCNPPDIPANGEYRSKSGPFLPGDKVSYSCYEGFTLLGKKQRTCQHDEAWSDSTPFCDRPSGLKYPWMLNIPSHSQMSLISNVTDNNSSTCFRWQNDKSQLLDLKLHEKLVLLEIRIFFRTGKVKIDIDTSPRKKNGSCAKYENNIATDQWVVINCVNSNNPTDTITISSSSADRNINITLCEIQVFTKNSEYECKDAPKFPMYHGFFVVERNKATLRCEEGYRGNGFLVCENNSWKRIGETKCEENLCLPDVNNYTLPPVSKWIFLDSVSKLSAGTRRQLKCSEGYRTVGDSDTVVCQKNGTWSKSNARCEEVKENTTQKNEVKDNTFQKTVMVAVGAAVAIIIIALLVIAICLIKKQRSREVVVVYKTSTDGSIAAGSEIEYGSRLYETIHYDIPLPPNSPRPAELPPILDNMYIAQEDSKNIMKQFTPADIAFGTLKESSLYGS